MTFRFKGNSKGKRKGETLPQRRREIREGHGEATAERDWLQQAQVGCVGAVEKGWGASNV
jgi:hypothetical protein